MKITRQQFLRVLPAAVLALSGCAASETAPASTEELVFDHACPLDYATQFTADCYEGGYTMLTLTESGQQFLVTPEDAAAVEGLPESVTVLRQPVRNIYLVSTSVMDLILHLDALDSVTLSGTKAEGWYLPEAKQAMEEGRIAYAGKYSAPDYEQILAANCGLAIENTMILHTPEVKEQLEHFGIPVLVERSSYESGPLERMEWIKLYGILLGKEEQAEQVFAAQEAAIAPLLEQEPTGKSCAFFSLSSNNLATVRKGSDYVAKMIEMAGGAYVFSDLTDNGNSLATMNLPLEDFYAGAKDADVLIYNSAIEGTIASVSQLTEKFPLLAEFKAVQNGQVWCTSQSLFQQSMALADLILDMNKVFTEGTPDADTLKFLTHVA
jgi:iron complex transport system substrate-binding protein